MQIRKVNDENINFAPVNVGAVNAPSLSLRKVDNDEVMFEGEVNPSVLRTTGEAPRSNGEEFVPHWSDYVSALNQGMTLGWSDELASGMGAAYDYAKGDGWTYDERVDASRKRMNQFRDDSPWATAGLETVGSVPTAFLAPAVKGWDTTNKLRSTARLAGEGAAWGSAVGAGTSESGILDDPLGLVTDTGVGAGIGAVLNPTMGAGGSWVGGKFVPNRNLEADTAFDVTTPVSERYPSTLGKVQNYLDTYTVGGAASASKRAKQYQDDAKEALRDLADGTGNARDVGTKYIKVKDSWQDLKEYNFRTDFELFRSNVDMDSKIIPTNTLGFLSSERSAYGGAESIADIVEIPSIKRLRKAMSNGEEVSIDTLWKLRQELGDSITTGKFGVDDISQAKAKALYANVSDDLYEGIYRNAGIDTADYFKALNDGYRQFQNDLDSIRPIFAKSNREQHSPEKVTAELVKRFRDEPSTLEPLRRILDSSDSGFLDDAAAGVLYQTALNRGQVGPTKALERYDLARSRSTNISGTEDIYPNPYAIQGAMANTSPARALVDNPMSGSVRDYERAIHLARRAEEATRNSADNMARQSIASGAIPALGGFAAAGPIGAAATTFAVNGMTYLLRRGLSSEVAAQRIDTIVRLAQQGVIPTEELRKMAVIFASDLPVQSD